MAYECLETVGTQRDFARLVGISDAAVSGLVGRGVIKKDQTLLVNLREYAAHLRGVIGRNGGGGRDQETLTQARIREANAKALRAEVETGKDLDLLVYQREVEPALLSWAARGAMALNGAERRIIDSIQSEFGIALEDSHVREHLRVAQRDIAGYAEELGADAEAGCTGVAPTRTGTDG